MSDPRYTYQFNAYCGDLGIYPVDFEHFLPTMSPRDIEAYVMSLCKQQWGPFSVDHFMDPDVIPFHLFSGEHCRSLHTDFGLYAKAVDYVFHFYLSGRVAYLYFDRPDLIKSLDEAINREDVRSTPEHITNIVLLTTGEYLIKCYIDSGKCHESCRWPDVVPRDANVAVREVMRVCYPLCYIISWALCSN